MSSPSGSDKTSVMISIKDRVGALNDILLAFKKYGINLTKIESRPSKKKAWDYVFFIDFIGHINDSKVKKALEAVDRSARSVKILGSYPRAE
jgi:chorismate mutase/prephenate dehydratase